MLSLQLMFVRDRLRMQRLGPLGPLEMGSWCLLPEGKALMFVFAEFDRPSGRLEIHWEDEQRVESSPQTH